MRFEVWRIGSSLIHSSLPTYQFHRYLKSDKSTIALMVDVRISLIYIIIGVNYK
jgi:hypothetical protein